jgi:hypothetical protein
MFGTRPVQKPYEGCLVHLRQFAGGNGPGQARADRHSGTLVERIPPEAFDEACERRAGGIPVKALAGRPWKGKNPGEHPAGGRANHAPTSKGLSEGSKPRSRGLAERVVAPVTATPSRETAGGFFRTETFRKPSERGRLRRVNPRSAAGTKQGWHGLGRSKPSRG